MPEDNTTPTTPPPAAPPTEPVEEVSSPIPPAEPGKNETLKTQNLEIIPEIVDKINDAQNILIALSSDPSVDEMASAIGLSLFLDKLGKRATAIYSGSTPNALEFLKPEETFEPTVDSLQDFVIAINKDKADHLRYKLEGDFVKIYITPYKTRIGEEDLDFSYGDFNVDLVISLDVANGVDLDSALREHGRIMHDAVIVNITTGNPGKLGEIEWSDKNASSIAEMISSLVYSMSDKAKMDKDEATALLTGVVAATSRFSNAKTTAESMRLASRLMESGANQQLISKNITADTQNEIFNLSGEAKKTDEPSEPNEPNLAESVEEPAPSKDDSKDQDANVLNVHAEAESPELLDDLKAAEESLAQTGAEVVQEAPVEPVPIEPAPTEPEAAPQEPTTEANSEGFISEKPEKVLRPSTADFAASLDESDQGNKYSHMLEDALSSIEQPPIQVPAGANPAASVAPTVPTSPEVNGVPQMNYMPLPGDMVLPPPPTPPIDMASVPVAPQPVMPEQQPVMMPQQPMMPQQQPMPQPVMQPQPVPTMPEQPAPAPAPADPSAFQIPGM